MAKMPTEEARSVPDPYGDNSEARLGKALASSARRKGGAPQGIDFDNKPGFAESLIPVWGSGREAYADFKHGDKVGGLLNAGLAVSDLFLAEAVAKGIAKGGVKLAAPYAWRLSLPERNAVLKVAKDAGKPAVWRNDIADARTYLEKQGFLKPLQDGHHAFVPQNGWGKGVPDWFKNQAWNIKAMPDAVTHGRVHGPWKDLPRFNPLEQFWHGTPGWTKPAVVSGVGHPAVTVYEAKKPNQ